MNARLLAVARAAPGFMPEDEGLALHRAALKVPSGHLLEIGSYCGKSAVYLGAAARRRGGLLFTVDHHRGSEEHQPGQPFHDASLVDPATGMVNTLPSLRATLARARLEDCVVIVVGASAAIAAAWRAPLAMVFIDGGHSQEAADADYHGWAQHLVPGGLLAIHDVFPDPADGGRPPHVVYLRAVAEGFGEHSATGSLRVLRRRFRASRRETAARSG